MDANQPLRYPYIKLALGDQGYQTSVSGDECEWNEGFEFSVTYHDLLFGSLDVYESRVLLPDRHIGRAQIRIKPLENFPQDFVSYFELWEKRYSSIDVNIPRLRLKNSGAIQVRIQFIPLVAPDTNPFIIESTNGQSEQQDVDVESEFIKRVQLELARVGSLHLIKNEEERSGMDLSRESSPSEDYLLSDSNKNKSQVRMSEQRKMSTAKSVPTAGILERIGTYALSQETQSALKAIVKLYSAFGQGFEIGNVELLASGVIIEKFYANQEQQSKDIVETSLQDAETFGHYHRFALASYGWRGLNFFGKGNGILRDAIRNQSDVLSIKEHLYLQEDDLISYDLHNHEIFRPSYYVAHDRMRQAVVLCIRGTMSAVDTLTDLVCDYQRWQGGLVHSGMKKSARTLLVDVIPQVLAYCHLNSVDKIVVVGHSLGAGTASLLAIMIHEQLHNLRETTAIQNLSVHCFAYGPPCTLDLTLATKYDDIIDAIIVNHDIVCGLSYGSMMDFKTMMLAASEMVDSKFKELLAYGGLQSADVAEQEWQQRFKVLATLNKRLTTTHNYPKLYIPGKIHHLVAVDNPKEYSTDLFPNYPPMVATNESTSDFAKVAIRPNMLKDHLPGSYDDALTAYRNTVMLQLYTS